MSMYIGADDYNNNILHVTSGTYLTPSNMTNGQLLNDTIFLSSKNITEVVDVTYTTISTVNNYTPVPANVEMYLHNSNEYSVFVYFYNGSSWDPQINTGIAIMSNMDDNANYTIWGNRYAPWAGKQCVFLTTKTSSLDAGSSIYIDANSFIVGGVDLYTKQFLVYNYTGAATSSSSLFNITGSATIGFIDMTTAVSTYLEDDSVGFYNGSGQKVEVFSRTGSNRVNTFLRNTVATPCDLYNMSATLSGVDTSVAYPVSAKMPCNISWDGDMYGSSFNNIGYFHITLDPTVSVSLTYAYAPAAVLDFSWNPATKLLHVFFDTLDAIEFFNAGPSSVTTTYYQM